MKQNNLDLQYQNLLGRILQAPIKPNRTGTPTHAIYGATIRHDMSEGFPLLTTKQVFHKMMRVELEGFLQGKTSKKWYKDRGCTIWNQWANPKKVQAKLDAMTFNSEEEKIKAKLEIQEEEDDLGPIYGYMWRHWPKPVLVDRINKLYKLEEIDQVAEAIATIKKDWTNRKQVVNAWNPAAIPEMALDPCHYSWHMSVTVDNQGEKILNLTWNQRSVDTFLGLPFNIASYGLLLTMLAQEIGMKPGILQGNLSDVHIYTNHVDQCNEQMSRTPFELPTVTLPRFTSVLEWDYTQFEVHDYKYHPSLKGSVAV